MDSPVKKLREVNIVRRALRCLDIDPDQWTLSHHESPDLLARTHQGELIGIEVSEVLPSEHGRQRALEHAAASIHRDPVEQYIRRAGGKGAVITGGLCGLPRHWDELAPVRAEIEQWLEQNGQPLHVDGGELVRKKPIFTHRFGQLTGISRDDSLGMFRLDQAGDVPPYTPPYKQTQSPYEIESLILDTVEKKVRKATQYARGRPIWLVLRNPHHGNDPVSEDLLAEVRTCNGGKFSRIILFNEPEDLIEAGMRGRCCADLLAG